jgi:glycosyltransferase involved in cell wall biosynthesis
MFNVVVHTPDVVGERMAGPGIRAWHLARELARHVPVTLIAKSEERAEWPGEGGELPNESGELRVASWQGVVAQAKIPGQPATRNPQHSGQHATGNPQHSGQPATRNPQRISHGSAAARDALRDASVLIGQPARGFRKRRREQRIVYDLFDPTVLELRELYGGAPALRQRIHLAAEWWRLAEALARADLLVCAAHRQRALYERLQSGEAPWIEVPFGIDPDEIAVSQKAADNLVVWGGGLWEWLDPAGAVEAILRVNAEGVPAKLLFLGRARPNRVVTASRIEQRRDEQFQSLLRRGGELVSANDAWVPYRQRLAWLRSAKIAIMLHRRTAEAEYSIRTRLFDAIAAGTPVIASAGGFAAELVEREGLGIVVPPGDVAAVADAIRRLMTSDEVHTACVRNLERIRPRFAWNIVTRPLVDAVLKWQT